MSAETRPIRNSYAITGMTLGILSIIISSVVIVPILAIIFSGIGLSKVKDRQGKGRAQAWMGLTLGILFTLVYLYRNGYI